MTIYNTVDKLNSVPIEELQGLAMEIIESSAVEEPIIFKVADLVFKHYYDEINLTFEYIKTAPLTFYYVYAGDELTMVTAYNDMVLRFLKL